MGGDDRIFEVFDRKVELTNEFGRLLDDARNLRFRERIGNFCSQKVSVPLCRSCQNGSVWSDNQRCVESDQIFHTEFLCRHRRITRTSSQQKKTAVVHNFSASWIVP
jgi:hypothetical protein